MQWFGCCDLNHKRRQETLRHPTSNIEPDPGRVTARDLSRIQPQSEIYAPIIFGDLEGKCGRG